MSPQHDRANRIFNELRELVSNLKLAEDMRMDTSQIMREILDKRHELAQANDELNELGRQEAIKKGAIKC